MRIRNQLLLYVDPDPASKKLPNEKPAEVEKTKTKKIAQKYKKNLGPGPKLL